MLLISLSVGGALGLLVAIILDRTVGKRTVTVEATRETVGNPQTEARSPEARSPEA
jgi:hypothetical protein